jgi:hexokinase
MCTQLTPPQHLPVTLTATVNDAASTLLSRAYSTPHTHYGLILGTGVNIAVHLPTSLVAGKLALRNINSAVSPPASPPSLSTSPGSSVSTGSALPPHDHVIVNTEISMFGAGVLPVTRFDTALDAAHALPGFQPLEMLVSGRYLGEVARLVIVEGFERGVLFADAKALPKGWERGYGLDTEVLAKLQVGEWKSLGLGIGERDGEALGRIAGAVAGRAERVVAASIYALRGVRDGKAAVTAEAVVPSKAEMIEGVIVAAPAADAVKEDTVVACAGAVIQFYPGFRQGAQEALDELCGELGQGRIELCLAEESSLLGAAVGAAVVAGGGEGR